MNPFLNAKLSCDNNSSMDAEAKDADDCSDRANYIAIFEGLA